jgi:hypothetical protein
MSTVKNSKTLMKYKGVMPDDDFSSLAVGHGSEQRHATRRENRYLFKDLTHPDRERSLGVLSQKI